MSANSKGVSVRILDKEYRIACSPGQEAILEDCAQEMDAQMRMIRQTGRVIGLDRIAIMAGLNIARKLICDDDFQPNETSQITSKLKVIQEKIDKTLTENNFTAFCDKAETPASENATNSQQEEY